MTDCSKENPILLSVLLLIGSLGTFVLPQTFRTPGGIFETSVPISYSEILSETSPILHIEFEAYEIKVEITRFETNNTPITMYAYSESNQSIIQIHNVTQLIDESFVIDAPPREKWFLNVTRQNSDTEVSLTILKWYLVIVDISALYYTYTLSPFLSFFALLFYALIQLYKLDRDCGIQIGFTLWEKRQEPLLIIVLIIIGATLTTPFAVGILRRDFEIIEHEEITEQSYSISLNESVNSIQLDLFEGEVFRFKIQSVTPQNSSIGLILHRSESIQQLTLANLSYPILWRLDIATANDSDLSIEIIRMDSDVRFDASLETRITWLAPKVDIVIPVILLVFGCVLLVYAFVITRRIHYLLRLKKVKPEEE